LKLRLRIGFVLLLLTFSFLSSGPITSSISTEHQHPIGIQESVTPSTDSPSLTWTSRTQNESLPLSNSSSAVGDHVVVNATFPEELNVTRCEMRIWNGFTYTTTRPLVTPTDPGGVFDGIIDPTQFDWVTITGIDKGMQVNVTGNFTNDDSDFMAWEGTLDQSEYTYANNILDMASGDWPENDVIIWESDNNTLVIGCLNYDGMIGNWTLLLQVGADVSIRCNGSTISMDTYYLTARNKTYNIRAMGNSSTNDTWTIDRQNVEFCNFFAPELEVYYPLPLLIDDKTFNISWSCSDRNTDDVNYYSVWLSNTDGLSYMLLAQNLTRTWCFWNSTWWLEDDYIIRVRAYSLDFTIQGMTDVSNPPTGYWPGDYSDALSYQHAGWPGIYDPGIDVGIESAPDIFYNEGEIGNNIEWIPYFLNWGLVPGGFHYYVYRNNTLIIDDWYNFYQGYTSVSINVDCLSEGFYNYTLYFWNPGSSGGIVRDVVFVTVGPPLHEAPQVSPFLLLSLQILFVVSITVVTLLGIIVLVNKGFDRDIFKRN